MAYKWCKYRGDLHPTKNIWSSKSSCLSKSFITVVSMASFIFWSFISLSFNNDSFDQSFISLPHENLSKKSFGQLNNFLLEKLLRQILLIGAFVLAKVTDFGWQQFTQTVTILLLLLIGFDNFFSLFNILFLLRFTQSFR